MDEEERRLVEKIAKGIHRTLPEHALITVDDLIAAGLFGLWQARERYDATRNPNWMAWASYRVRGAMFDWIRHVSGREGQGEVFFSLDAGVRNTGIRRLELPSRENTPEQETLENEKRRYVARRLRSLPRRMRAVAERTLQGWSRREIGEQLGLTASGVNANARLALQRLRAQTTRRKKATGCSTTD